MVGAVSARFATTWRGWSGRPYVCAILYLAEAKADPDRHVVVAFAVVRNDGFARQTSKPTATPLTEAVLDSARRAGGATELHVYPPQAGDDLRAIVEDLRRAA